MENNLKTKAKSTKKVTSKFKKNLRRVIIAIIVTGIPIKYATDFLWFKEIGYIDVFLKKFITELEYGVPIFLVLFALVFFYLKSLRKEYLKKITSRDNTNLSFLKKFEWIVSLLFSAIVSYLFVSELWFDLLKFQNSTSFKLKDPIFNKDISFYIFELGFLESINRLLIFVIINFVLITLIYYIILFVKHKPDAYNEDEAEPYYGNGAEHIYDENKKLNNVFSNFANIKNRKTISSDNFKEIFNIGSRQLTTLGVIFFLMLGIYFYLKQFSLLHSHTGVVYGPGFTDVNVVLWSYRILGVLSIVAAFATVIFVKQKKYKGVLYVPALMVATGVLSIIVISLVQSMIVAPDEINKEKAYLTNNIKYTRAAYGITDVDVKPFSANRDLTAKDLAKNNETVRNIRINDYEPVKTFYNQTQSIRQYYKFNDVDVDRYTLDGKYTQTYMSMREIDEEKISDTWLNRHLKYTHGYGFALSRVDKVTPSGKPDLLVKNIPPVSSVKSLKISEPEIYFGELSNDYIVVHTKEDEFDYPSGQSNKYNRYKGKAGIKLNFFNRLMFSIKEGSMKLLVSTNINKDSKIIVNRNIKNRISEIMPYLTYENDPYAVTVDGKLYWMMDAYTTSSYYPYSEPFKSDSGEYKNYVRNSVKVVVDAYNGNVDFYIVDKNDPIAKTYSKIYKGLFKNIEKMPKGLKAHIRYPNDLAKIQADIYSRYHMKDVKVFYQNEDLWDIANEIYGTKEKEMSPNYYIAKLPGEKKAEFLSMLPFTPKSKQNMTGLLVVRNDGKNYGKIIVYQFPKNKTVYGPMQIEAQIDQNTEISQDFSLWSQAGSKYSRGNLFVVPIENSLLYVEPIYLEASNSAIPEVKRIVVVYGDKIAYKPTLGEALESLFGEGIGLEKSTKGNSSKETKTKEMTLTDYIKNANSAFDNAQKALKKGDWTQYGKNMDELSKALHKMKKK